MRKDKYLFFFNNSVIHSNIVYDATTTRWGYFILRYYLSRCIELLKQLRQKLCLASQYFHFIILLSISVVFIIIFESF